MKNSYWIRLRKFNKKSLKIDFQLILLISNYDIGGYGYEHFQNGIRVNNQQKIASEFKVMWVRLNWMSLDDVKATVNKRISTRWSRIFYQERSLQDHCECYHKKTSINALMTGGDPNH